MKLWVVVAFFQGTRTGVPHSRTCTTMVFIVFNLWILGGNLPINTHVI